MRVFISHSSRDKRLVRAVLSHMPAALKPWLDEAKRGLKAANVPHADAKELLELVGVSTQYKKY